MTSVTSEAVGGHSLLRFQICLGFFFQKPTTILLSVFYDNYCTSTLPCTLLSYSTSAFDGGRVVKRFYKCFHSPTRLLLSAPFLALSIWSPETAEAFFTFSLLSLLAKLGGYNSRTRRNSKTRTFTPFVRTLELPYLT